jgi:hypothetical protein
MNADLKNKLPSLYKHFITKEQHFKKRFGKAPADKKRVMKQEWSELQHYETTLINQIISFELTIQQILSKSTFFNNAPKDVKIPLPKKLSDLFEDQDEIKAFFEDIKLFSLFLFKKCKANTLINYNWKLSRTDVLTLTFQLHTCKDDFLAQKGLCAKKAPIPAKKNTQQELVEEETESFDKKSYSKEDYESAMELFESFRKFEQTILKIYTRDEKKEFMTSITEEILNNTSAKNILNFSYLHDYDNFTFEPYPENFKNLLLDEAGYYLSEESNLPDMLIDDILEDEKMDKFLKTYAMRLFKEFKDQIKMALADNFFDTVSQASSWDKIYPVIQQAITGTKRFNPIFDVGQGHLLIHKADQLWTRVRQANLQFQKELDNLDGKFSEYEKKVYNYEKNLTAIDVAAHYSLADITKFDANKLCDIAVNDDGECNEEKRIVQFIPKGEITMHMKDVIDKGKTAARTDIRREDFRKALKYYTNLHVNNTPDSMQRRFNEYESELPKFEAKLEATEVTIGELETKGLEEFDDSLHKIKEIFVLNVGKLRVV